MFPVFKWFQGLFWVFLIIIPRARIRYEMVDSLQDVSLRVGYNHLISNQREWNNYFIKNAPKINGKQEFTLTLDIFVEQGITAHTP